MRKAKAVAFRYKASVAPQAEGDNQCFSGVQNLDNCQQYTFRSIGQTFCNIG